MTVLISRENTEVCIDKDGEIYFVSVDEDLVQRFSEDEIWNEKEFTAGEKAVCLDLMGTAWPKPRIDMNTRERDLRKIFDRLCGYLRKYVYLTSEDHYEYIATWVISTYLQHPHFRFRYAPPLQIDGVTQAGKSTLLKVLNEVCYRPSMASGYTAASISRDIHDYGCTMLIDEAVDNLSTEKGGEIIQIIKNAFERTAAVWKRADPKGHRNFTYSVYTSFAISTKADILPEDVVNRGIRIPMVTMPPSIILGDIDSVWEDDRGEECSPDTIRNDLYSYRLAHMAFSGKDPGYEDWVSARKRTVQHLTVRSEDGRWYYEYATGIRDGGRIYGRNRNIASTMYSIALEVNAEIGVLNTIINNERYAKEVVADTMESMTFCALVDTITDKWINQNFGELTKDNKMEYEDFCGIVEGLTTTDVADRYNNTLTDLGDGGRDPVPTRTITAKLLALGLKYERGAQRRSWLRPRHPDFVPRFLQHLRVYSPNQVDFFSHLKVNDGDKTGERK